MSYFIHKGAAALSQLMSVARGEKKYNLELAQLPSSFALFPPSLLPLGGGGPSGWRPALGVRGGVCVSKRGAVLPLQGPLGAAPGYTHVGKHQVRAMKAEAVRHDTSGACGDLNLI